VYADTVVAKVRASNAVGWGSYSDPNSVGALVQTEPVTATTPTPTRGSRTDDTRVEVAWTAITLAAETGGSPITSYNLQWNTGDGSENFVDLVGQEYSEYTSSSYLLVAGVAAGTTYKFRLRAANKWGFGGFSAIAEIEASAAPGQVPPPTTEISGTNARISWTSPADYGNTISAYSILLLTSGGTYAEESVHCDGTQPSIVASLDCEIPLTVLRASPYDLVYADQVIAKVSATNDIGVGPVSDPAGDATIQTEPV